MLPLIAVLATALLQPAQPSVVFVCAHGAAKSVIAATYFNKLAVERGLPYRATFRGVTPDPELSARALEGLKGDGLAPLGHELLVEDIEQLEERHLVGDLVDLVGLECAGRVGPRLAPYPQGQLHA